jgi:hypothetical protein
MKRSQILAAVALGAASVAQASVVFFDDAPKNGAAYWQDGSATSVLAPAGEPFAGASPCIKLTMTAWPQAGVYINTTVSAPDTVIEAQIYRVDAGDLHLRYGGGWTDMALDATNNNAWTIDGQPGDYSFSNNAWHTLRVDVAALGITDTVNTIGMAAGGSTRVWYMDNVQVTSVPEPTAMGLIGLSALGVLGRRRRA